MIEREIPSDFATRPQVLLRLSHPNFETATNIVDAINRRFGNVATTADGTSVEVAGAGRSRPSASPSWPSWKRCRSRSARTVPKVVFNSRTGTVVIADGLRVKAAAVTHGSLKVVISESSTVSQPAPFSAGQTGSPRNRT